MRALLQRVSTASVEVAGERVGEIGIGLLALVAAGVGDGEPDALRLARKIAALRVCSGMPRAA
jgi:D-aminoacyl-tRNA deacylase